MLQVVFLCACLLCILSAETNEERWKQVSVTQVLTQDPVLKRYLHPMQMARLINEVPMALREIFRMQVYAVIDGKTSSTYCFGIMCTLRWYFGNGRVLTDFLNTYSKNMSIKDLYLVMLSEDRIHYDTVRAKIGPLPTTNPEQFESIYQHYSDLLMKLPSFRMSIDFGDSLLERNKFLLPDAYMLQEYSWHSKIWTAGLSGIWEDNYKKAKDGSAKTLWENKLPKVFWRGADSGIALVTPMDEIWANPAKYHPRVQIVRLSKEHPNQIDAGFTLVSEYFSDRLRKLGLPDKRVPSASIEQHLKCKYLISIDGWTAAWMRVPWILASNSLLLKQESLKVEWFDYALKPKVHYYPIKSDLSDLLDAIEYLEAHQEEAKQIVRNANAFVEEFLSREKINAAAAKVLKDYAAAQNFTFTKADRELILDFGIPYHEFAHLYEDGKQTLINDCIYYSRIGKLIIGFSVLLLLCLVCCCKWAKLQTSRLSNRFSPLNNEEQQMSPEIISDGT